MPATKAKFGSRLRRQRRSRTTQRTNGKGLNDAQLTALLEAYQAMGKMLETFVGRERLYCPQFLKGLENALQDVAMGRTQEVKTFDDFAR